MPKKQPAPELADALREAQTMVAALREIAQIRLFPHAEDASAAIASGAVLLGITRVDNDRDGEGFRYLLGLPRGVPVTPFLAEFFKK